jgi:hypothetical protein
MKNSRDKVKKIYDFTEEKKKLNFPNEKLSALVKY